MEPELPVPHYLEQAYWWAYVHPKAVHVFERDWLVNADSAPEWDAVAFATSNWLRLTPDELGQVADEVVEVLVRWGNRELPDDGAHREPVYVYARGFPSQP